MNDPDIYSHSAPNALSLRDRLDQSDFNALDYAYDAPHRIHAVDANPRQSALLELKIATIRRLEFADFCALFVGVNPKSTCIKAGTG